MPQDVGCTLREAVRRTVDPDLLKQCVSAKREWRKAGAPRRFVRSFGPGHDNHSDEATRNRHLKNVRNALLKAADAVVDALRAHLISGQLVARGRRGSPLAEIVTIPASAWKVLKFKDFGRSIVAEPNKTAIYELRIVPALHAEDIAHRLHDEPLVKAFDFFVFNDPQVVSLRKRAIARGGRPRNIGFQSRLYQAYWYTDYGIPPEPDSMGSTIDEHELGNARAADAVLRGRFRRIIQLLLDGAIVAEGVPARDGVPVKIPRAMWFRKGGVLDLYKGDYFEQYPDPSVSEDQVSPLYLSLMLKRPSGSAETLHVKPTAYGQVPSSTILHVDEAAPPPAEKSKAIESAKTRQQVWRECVQWLEEEMRKSPGHKPFPKPYWRAEAKAEWGGLLSYRAFDDAWDEAVKNSGATAWAAAGAPKRSRQ